MTRLGHQAGERGAGAGDILTPLDFFKLLQAGKVAGNGYIEIRYLKSGGKHWQPWPCHEFHPDVFTPDKAPAGKDVYFGVAHRKDTSDGKAHNCKMTGLVWADVDLADHPEITGGQTKESLLQADAAELLEYKNALLARCINTLAEHGLSPRAAVDSGHGVQLYLALEASIPHDETERHNKALAALLGGDQKSTDIARILRVPGTQNLKNPERPLPVRVMFADEQATVTTEALEALPTYVKPSKQGSVSPVKAPAKVAEGKTLGAKERYARRALEDEVEALRGTTEGGRNDQLNISAVKLGGLVAAGELDEVEVRAELTAAAQAVGLPDDEIRATLQSGLEFGKTQPRDLSHVGTRASSSARGTIGGAGDLAQPGAGGLPEIVTNGRQLREKTTETQEVMLAKNQRDPQIFLRFGDLVRVVEDEVKGETVIKAQTMLLTDVVSEMSDAADFVSIKRTKDGEEVATQVNPPVPVAQDIMSRRHKTPWPKLKLLARAPMFDAAGQLVARDGYHASSGIYLTSRLKPVALPSVAEAVALLDEVFCDFPLASPEAGRAHLFAGMVAPAARLLYNGPAPLVLINAGQQANGKTLMSKVLSLIATGGGAVTLAPLPARLEEQQKDILSRLSEDQPVIILDNMKHLGGEVLASVLTSENYSGRLLGASKILTVENKSLWIATGNNPTMDNEMPRRIISVRLKSDTNRPEERDNFKHQPLDTWVKSNMPRLYAAVLALVSNWLEQGRPRFTERRLGGFEDWAEVVGGVLQAAGIAGFLTDREELYQAATADQDGDLTEWGQLLAALYEASGMNPAHEWRVKEVFGHAEALGLLSEQFEDSRTAHGKTRRMAALLNKHRGRVFAAVISGEAGQPADVQLQLQPQTDARNKTTVWQVVPAGDVLELD